MALKEYLKGSTIINTIELWNDNETVQIDILNDVEDLYFFVFNQNGDAIKFSKKVEEGFELLERVTDLQYKAIITPLLSLNLSSEFCYTFVCTNLQDVILKGQEPAFLLKNNIGQTLLTE